MATDEISPADIDALVLRVGEAADAYMRGDMDTYLRHIHHAEDYTLMSPFGGEVVHGFDPSPEQLPRCSPRVIRVSRAGGPGAPRRCRRRWRW